MEASINCQVRIACSGPRQTLYIVIGVLSLAFRSITPLRCWRLTCAMLHVVASM